MSDLLDPDNYTVAWIAPLLIEAEAALGVLDRRHDGFFDVRRGDDHLYLAGEINKHNIVIATLPAGHNYGVSAAAALATSVKLRFPNLQFALLVGVAAGLPNLTVKNPARQRDIRLGDVLVCVPDNDCNGVVQYDLGRETPAGFFPNNRQAEIPAIVRSAIGQIQLTKGNVYRIGQEFDRYLSALQSAQGGQKFSYPSKAADRLHTAVNSTVAPPEVINRVHRDGRERTRVWYGRIGSGNSLVRDPVRRDNLRDQYDLIGLEMEAAGVMNVLPTGIIRGVCDYGDSFKAKDFQPYAAAVAAVYAKGLLRCVHPAATAEIPRSIQQSEPSQLSRFCTDVHLDKAPLMDSSLFVGRGDELRQMDEGLKPNSLSQEQRRIVLGGPGGIGKTQLALAYIRQYSSVYQSIFWFDATSVTTLRSSLQLIVNHLMQVNDTEHLNEQQLFERMRRWLSNSQNTKWLLVFDNYDELDEFEIESFIPRTLHGAVIVTTRLPDSVSGQILLISPLRRVEESLKILETRSHRQNIEFGNIKLHVVVECADNLIDEYAHQLVKRLDGYPLALATAGSYLRRSVMTFQQYLGEYSEKWNLDPRRPPKLLEYRNRTLYTTWNISFVRLVSEDPVAARLFKLLAYFDHENITFIHLKAGQSNDLPGWLLDLLDDETFFHSTMGSLVEYGLLDAQPEHQAYRVHACVHDWITAGLHKVYDSWSYWYALDCVAVSARLENRSELGHIRYNRLAPHATRLTLNLFDQVGEFDLTAQKRESQDRLVSVERVVFLLYYQLKFQEVIAICERYRLGFDEYPRLGDVILAGLYEALAYSYRHLGQLDEAEQILLTAIDIKKRWYGLSSFATILTIDQLGHVYTEQGRLKLAESMFLMAAKQGFDAHKLREVCASRWYPKDTVVLLSPVVNLAHVYWDKHEINRPIQLCELVITFLRSLPMPCPVEERGAMTLLASAYERRCEWSKAASALLELLKSCKDDLGMVHQMTIDVTARLAELFIKTRRPSEALPYIEGVLRACEGTSQQHSFQGLRLFTQKARSLFLQGEWDEAERLYLHVLQLLKRSLGEYNSLTLNSRYMLGVLYSTKNDIQSSEKTFEGIIETCEHAGNVGSSYCRISYACALASTIRNRGVGSLKDLQRLAKLTDLAQASSWNDVWITRCLARGLMRYGDEEGAKYVLRLSIQDEMGKAQADHTDLVCDGCNNMITFQSGLNVCMDCQECDLCHRCMTVYLQRELKIPFCMNHAFFRVDFSSFEIIKCRGVQDKEAEYQVLNGICEKYGVDVVDRSKFANVEPIENMQPSAEKLKAQEARLVLENPILNRIWALLMLDDEVGELDDNEDKRGTGMGD